MRTPVSEPLEREPVTPRFIVPLLVALDPPDTRTPTAAPAPLVVPRARLSTPVLEKSLAPLRSTPNPLKELPTGAAEPLRNSPLLSTPLLTTWLPEVASI